MAEIALRAYVKEIDDLVEHEQLDEAIAHSRHLLETYPKHLDTYRLLGKAYLEAKRYGDSADLFQRVLSAIPDDFVAHIGMSIVREDEGNLDASIWHMERAFETNPANPAIQQELRRLIGKRDGLEPHKVRLTRGALARMYAHGELYPQAIAELRSALQEDPDRPDLQVLLANLYWRTDQKEQAAEVAQQTLEKLPYCRDANRIAAGFLQGIGRTEEATPSHRRLAALDPYAAFVETATVDPATVDPGSVHLMKLEWRPGHPVATPDLPRPSWSDSLGAGLRAESKPAAAPEGPLPTWLAPDAPAAAPPARTFAPPQADESAGSIHPFAGAKEPPAEIPTWMKEAGWSESSGEAVEGPVSFTDDELAAAAPAVGEGELAPAEIPDWLMDIAPQQMPDESDSPDASDWLGEAAAEGALPAPPVVSLAPGPAPSEKDGGERSEVPTWLEEPSPGATETIVTWLGDRTARAAAFQQPPAPPVEPEPTPAPVTDQPDWLAQGDFFGDEEAVEATPPAEEGPPAWLTGVAEAAASEAPIAAEPPSWVTEAPAEEPEEEEVAPEPASSAAAPDWLRAIAEPGVTPAPSPQAEADWLAGLSSAAASKPKPADTSGPEWLRGIGEPEAQDEVQPAESSAPDWLRGLGGSAPPAAPEGPPPSRPDWLRDTPAPKPAGTTGASLGAAGAGIDWLRGIGEPEPVPATHEPGTAAPEPPVAGDDWLRGLVDRGPAAAAEQPPDSVPEEWTEGAAAPAPAEPPDWLGRLAAAGPPPEPSGAVSEPSWLEEMAAEGEPEAEEPDWVQQMPGLAQPPAAQIPGPATDDWLKGLLDEAPLPAEPAVPEQAGEPDWFAPQAESEDTGMDSGANIRVATTGWLREAGEQPIPPDALEPSSAPDWLKEFEAAGTPAAPPTDQTIAAGRGRDWGQDASGARPPVGTMDASAAGELGEDDVQKWLEALASRQEAGSGAGIEEAPPPESSSFFPPVPPPEPAAVPEEPEEGMEWLEHLSGQAKPKPEPVAASWQPVDQEPEHPRAQAAPPPEPEEEEVPDWLRSLAAEGEAIQTSEAHAAAEDQGPDWLQAAASSTVIHRAVVEPPLPPEPPEAFEGLEEEEAPDWLRGPAAEPPPSFVPEPTPEVPEDAEGTPTWLLTAAADEAEAAEPERAYQEEETGGMPDWLLKAAEPPETARPIVPSEPDELYAEPTAAPEPPEPERPAAAPEPSWMRPSEPASLRPVVPESEIVVPEWLRAPVELPRPPEPTSRPAPIESAVVPVPLPPSEVVPAEAPAPIAAEPVVTAPPVSLPPEPAPAPVIAPVAAEAAVPEPPEKEVPAPPRPPKARTTARSPQETLAAARQAVASDDLQGAAKHYGALIRRRTLLTDVVVDLKVAVDRMPDSPELWQALGDAYMKADRAAEAVEAYRHGLANL
jgi:tetratricopeptide (TPR) repeat protein